MDNKKRLPHAVEAASCIKTLIIAFSGITRPIKCDHD